MIMKWFYVSFMNNNQQSKLYSNTYILEWRDHPKFSYKNNRPQQAMGPPSFQKAMIISSKKSNLEILMENFLMMQTRQNDDFRNHNLHTNEVLQQLTIKIELVATHNKMLETYITQVVQTQASTFVPPRSFLGQPEQNTMGHRNVVTTQSGKQVVSSNEWEKEVYES